MGLGGDTTALAVHVELADTHISQLPVAVNIQCWAARRASAVIGSDVARHGMRLMALFANRTRNLFGGADLETMDPDRGALTRENTREACSGATIATRDERSLSCEF